MLQILLTFCRGSTEIKICGIGLFSLAPHCWQQMNAWEKRFRSINNELMATDEFEVMSLEADEDEHSIEMHLPYIARVMQRQSPGYVINT